MTIITASTRPDDQGTITVKIPIDLLHRAQCACSDYGDYGSGDAEHDTLGEFVDLTVTAAGIPGTGEWTLTAPITNPAAITPSSLWTIAAAVPSDLGDTLEFQAQKGGGRYLLVGSVRDQPFGVTAAAARELAAAVAAHLGEPVAVTVAAAGMTSHAPAGARPAAPSHARTAGAPLELTDHAAEDYIEWWAVPADNALRFRHIGCDGATSTYTNPLDDVPLPLTRATEECAHCCQIRPLRRRETPVEQFTLDRQALADHLTAEGLHENDGRPPGLVMLDCSPAAAVASFFSHAIDAGAIGGPGDLDVVVYEQDGDALLIAVREKDPWISVRVPERQIGRWALEAKHLCDYRDSTFEEACRTIEAVLSYAGELIATLRAVQLLAEFHEAIAVALMGAAGDFVDAALLAQRVITAGAALVRQNP